MNKARYYPLFFVGMIFIRICTADTAFQDEIIVTAKKHPTNQLETPVSTSVVDQHALSNFNIDSLSDLDGRIANFTIAETPLADRIAIRGVQSGAVYSFEQSVPTFVDGIYRGRSEQSRFSFLDIESVEVVRGPQNTLFGKNALGGALIINPAKPTPILQGKLTIERNLDFEEDDISGFISGPVTDNVLARFAFLNRDQDKGWVENEVYDQHFPQKKDEAYRLTLVMGTLNTLQTTLRYDHGNWLHLGGMYELGPVGSLAALGLNGDRYDYSAPIGNDAVAAEQLTGIPASVFGNTTPLDFGNSERSEGDSNEIALTFERKLDNGTLLSALFGYSKYDKEHLLDADFNPLPVITVEDDQQYNQKSLELRLHTDINDSMEFQGGLYYQKNDLHVNFVAPINLSPLLFLTQAGCAANGGSTTTSAGVDYDGDGTGGTLTDDILATLISNAGAGTSAATAGSCLQQQMFETVMAGGLEGINDHLFFDQETKTWAAFGELTWYPTNTIRTMLGLRYTDEKKSASQGASAAVYEKSGTTPLSDPNDLFAASVIVGVSPHSYTTNDPGMTRNDESVSWSASVDWEATESLLLYTAASKGHKSGGYNFFYRGDADGSHNSNNADFDEEAILSLEVGLKTHLDDYRTDINLTYFNSRYDDMQVSSFNGDATFIIQNAAKANIQGIEFDSRWQATDRLGIQASLGWLDFEYDEFPNQNCTANQLTELQETVWASGDISAPMINAATCASLGINDLKRKTSAFAPDYTGSITLDYRFVYQQLRYSAIIGASYKDGYYVDDDLDDNTFMDSYTQVDATLQINTMDQNWTAAILVNNLTDEESYYTAFDTPLFSGAYNAQMNPPRSVTLRGGYSF